ncbi:MAG: cob(I)yrinic acid a,c-diamide adenosyltransferase [Verrucomicrobia bacterium]|nr:MAG: cob(I)yrinic acid a,c-diamide adenosyltransferase [Verrucomicrobiota bacterium]
MKISTKNGDGGKTGLMFARPVSKASQRVRAYGMVDEFSASLGLARAFAAGTELAGEILDIQKTLVKLMTELATDEADFPKLAEKNIPIISAEDLKKIEVRIDALEGEGNVFSGWKQSGESPLQAALDMARAKCRSAEREVVALSQAGSLARPLPLEYLNRLADLLYLFSQR